MIGWLIPSLFLAISQGILTNRVIKRWENYDDEVVTISADNWYGCINKKKNKIDGGILNPLLWGISSGFLAPLAWATYILGYILAISMISNAYNGYDCMSIFISQLILWINSYTYGKMFGYVFVLLTFLVVYSFKFTFIIPVYFLDDLLQGNLRKPDSKVRDYINKSIEVFNFVIKD